MFDVNVHGTLTSVIGHPSGLEIPDAARRRLSGLFINYEVVSVLASRTHSCDVASATRVDVGKGIFADAYFICSVRKANTSASHVERPL